MKYRKCWLGGPLVTGIFSAFWYYHDMLVRDGPLPYLLFLVCATGVIYIIPNRTKP